MTMGIYIPSCGRTANMRQGVARFASPKTKQQMVYIVPPAEHEQYARALSAAGIPSGVITCPEKGIARTRRWIGELARSQGHDKFLMLDDDVWFYTRTTEDPSDFHLVYSEPAQVDDMLDMVENCLGTYAHVGISAREGNNRMDQLHAVALGDGVIVPQLHCFQNTRTLRALAYQTAEFLKCEHGRVAVMEDFDVNLQLLERGLPNLNLAHWAQGQRQTNAPGGCSTYRSQDVQTASANRLAELHPGIVALREKKNKSGGDFGHRTEVTIQWAKAYKQGLASRKIEPAPIVHRSISA